MVNFYCIWGLYYICGFHMVYSPVVDVKIVSSISTLLPNTLTQHSKEVWCKEVPIEGENINVKGGGRGYVILYHVLISNRKIIRLIGVVDTHGFTIFRFLCVQTYGTIYTNSGAKWTFCFPEFCSKFWFCGQWYNTSSKAWHSIRVCVQIYGCFMLNVEWQMLCIMYSFLDIRALNVRVLNPLFGKDVKKQDAVKA